MKEKGYKNYLEIGVSNGHIFFRIKTDFKIAVDPDFQFDMLLRMGKAIMNPYNLYNKYYEITSDEFFEKHSDAVIGNRKIDLAFVDGMHEYDFALRDIENSLKYLGDDGVIIVHDCNPLTKNAARPFKEFKGGAEVPVKQVKLCTFHQLRRPCPVSSLAEFVCHKEHTLGKIEGRR